MSNKFWYITDFWQLLACCDSYTIGVMSMMILYKIYVELIIICYLNYFEICCALLLKLLSVICENKCICKICKTFIKILGSIDSSMVITNNVHYNSNHTSPSLYQLPPTYTKTHKKKFDRLYSPKPTLNVFATLRPTIRSKLGRAWIRSVSILIYL